MDFDSFVANSDVGGVRINPAARVVVMHAVLLGLHSGVSVSAENALRVVLARVG